MRVDSAGQRATGDRAGADYADIVIFLLFDRSLRSTVQLSPQSSHLPSARFEYRASIAIHQWTRFGEKSETARSGLSVHGRVPQRRDRVGLVPCRPGLGLRRLTSDIGRTKTGLSACTLHVLGEIASRIGNTCNISQGDMWQRKTTSAGQPAQGVGRRGIGVMSHSLITLHAYLVAIATANASKAPRRGPKASASDFGDRGPAFAKPIARTESRSWAKRLVEQNHGG
jgi:hypothetical protein